MSPTSTLVTVADRLFSVEANWLRARSPGDGSLIWEVELAG